MLYILAILCPPMACFCSGRFLQAIINLAFCLTVLGVPLAMIHAWWIVKSADRARHLGIVINNYAGDRR